MKKVFITGGSGTVGINFIEFNFNKYEIYSYSRNEKAQVALKRAYPSVEIILGSVEDKLNLENVITKIKPDIIIHTAALKHVETCIVEAIVAEALCCKAVPGKDNDRATAACSLS